MPLFKSAPPPQPVQQATDQRGMFTPTWADWFFRLREKLEQVTILPTLGTANQLLSVNAGATDLEYKTLSGTANQITVTFGVGTATLTTPQDIATASSPTFAGLTLSGLTANTLLYANGSKALSSLGLVNGQLAIGSTGANPVAANITEGNGVTVTNGAGSITLTTNQMQLADLMAFAAAHG